MRKTIERPKEAITKVKTGKLDMFSVFTTNELSLSAGVLFHEYSHPFINPLTDRVHP